MRKLLSVFLIVVLSSVMRRDVNNPVTVTTFSTGTYTGDSYLVLNSLKLTNGFRVDASTDGEFFAKMTFNLNVSNVNGYAPIGSFITVIDGGSGRFKLVNSGEGDPRDDDNSLFTIRNDKELTVNGEILNKTANKLSVFIQDIDRNERKQFEIQVDGLPNNSPNQFESIGQPAIFSSGDDVKLADFDYDTDLDAIAGNKLLKNMSGIFSSWVDVSPSGSVKRVYTGDITGNGYLDIIYVAGATIRVWENTNNTFQLIQTINDKSYLSAALGDINGDGLIDLFVTHFSGSRVYLNNGGGELLLDIENDLFFPFNFGVFCDVELSDFDQDSDLDALLAGCSSVDGNRLGNSILLINNSGVFDSHNFLQFYAERVRVADFNNDGKLDFVAGAEAERGKVYKNIGNNTFLVIQDISGDFTDIEIADFNGDGFMDIFLLKNSNQGQMWLNTGLEEFSLAQLFDTHSGLGVAAGDLDGNGHMDIYVINGSSEPNQVWLNKAPASGRTKVDQSEPESIDQNIKENFPESFVIYPNPTTNELNLNFPKAYSLNRIKLVDLKGQEIKTYNYFGAKIQRLKLQLPRLPEGIYLLEMITENEVFKKRVSIEH